MIDAPDWIDNFIRDSNRRYAERNRQIALDLPAPFFVQFDDSHVVSRYSRVTVTVAEGVLYSSCDVHVNTDVIRDARGRIMREFPTMRDLMDCLRARGKVTLVWNDDLEEQ